MITRRTALRTTLWSAPAITVAAASPAFASSCKENDVHTCDREKCKPKVTRRKKKYSKGYKYETTSGCVFANPNKNAVIHWHEKIVQVVNVEWIPFDTKGPRRKIVSACPVSIRP